MIDPDHLSLSRDQAFLDAADKLYASAPFAYVATDGSGRVLLVNQALLLWLGYTRQELQLTRRLPDLFTPGGRLFYETHLAPILLTDGAADEVALDLVSKHGEVLPALVSARQTTAPDSGLILNRWTIFKATERRNFERQLVSTRNLLETTLASIGDGMVTTDANAAVVFLNDVAADVTGWDPDLAVGRPIEEVLTLTREDTTVPIENPIRKALRIKAKGALENHTILLPKTGQQLVIDDSAAPILSEDGALLGAVMVFRDITGRRQVEQELAAAYQELQANATELRRSNEDLAQFAFAASHDLQSPLKTVTMFSQLLQHRYSDKLDPAGLALVSQIEGATKRLGTLIEDLLAFSTVSSHAEQPLAPVDANLVLALVRDNLRGIILESGATLHAGPLPTLPVDQTSLLQLLQNLIANAIRYRALTPPQIQISAERAGSFWHFACHDNGIGIAPEHYQKIFEPFKRLHGHEIPGSGIGLALCEKVVQRYGGRIWVESVVAQGSTFHFTLPA